MKATMPQPVAEVCSGHALHWAGSGPIAPMCDRTGAKVGSLLITTTQAEAYADARVREALQVVAGTVEQYHPKATPKGIAAAIRLIASTDGLTAPPLPGPVEPLPAPPSINGIGETQ